MRGWIRAEDTLPEKGKKVLVCGGKGVDCYDIAAVDECWAWTGLLGGGALALPLFFNFPHGVQTVFYCIIKT